MTLQASDDAALPAPPDASFERVASVAELDALEPGEPLAARTAAGAPVCIARVGADVVAVADLCTHAHFPLSSGAVHPDGSIECVWHGARFDCRTGRVLRGPADEPVLAYAVRIVGPDVLVAPRES